MAVLATILGAMTGVLWTSVVYALYTGRIRHRWKLYLRSTRPRDYWRRVGVVTLAAVLATIGLVMIFVLRNQ